MVQAATRMQILIARLAVALIVILLALGLLWYGMSMEVQKRLWADILERPGGPMTFRFVLQPSMAALAALHDGIKDAREGRPPYLWTLITCPEEHSEYLREALISTGRIILLGLGMDAIYQATVLKTFYPGEMAIVALLLAFVPYLILRGPFARIARWWITRRTAG